MKTSNEISYDFISNRSLDLASSFIEQDQHFIARKKTRDVLVFVNINYKRHYDRKHQSLFLKFGEYALLKLHKKYFISFTLDMIKKLTQQFVRSFKILVKVERLIYRLEIPTH